MASQKNIRGGNKIVHEAKTLPVDVVHYRNGKTKRMEVPVDDHTTIGQLKQHILSVLRRDRLRVHIIYKEAEMEDSDLITLIGNGHVVRAVVGPDHSSTPVATPIETSVAERTFFGRRLPSPIDSPPTPPRPTALMFADTPHPSSTTRMGRGRTKKRTRVGQKGRKSKRRATK